MMVMSEGIKVFDETEYERNCHQLKRLFHWQLKCSICNLQINQGLPVFVCEVEEFFPQGETRFFNSTCFSTVIIVFLVTKILNLLSSSCCSQYF